MITWVANVKATGRFHQTFVALLENLDFNYLPMKLLCTYVHSLHELKQLYGDAFIINQNSDLLLGL